jgi:hypothetical protein
VGHRCLRKVCNFSHFGDPALSPHFRECVARKLISCDRDRFPPAARMAASLTTHRSLCLPFWAAAVQLAAVALGYRALDLPRARARCSQERAGSTPLDTFSVLRVLTLGTASVQSARDRHGGAVTTTCHPISEPASSLFARCVRPLRVFAGVATGRRVAECRPSLTLNPSAEGSTCRNS